MAELKESTHCFWHSVESSVLWFPWIQYHLDRRYNLWVRLVLHPTNQWDIECLYLRDSKTQSTFPQTYHESNSLGTAYWLLLDSEVLFLEPDHLGASGTG